MNDAQLKDAIGMLSDYPLEEIDNLLAALAPFNLENRNIYSILRHLFSLPSAPKPSNTVEGILVGWVLICDVWQ